MVEFFETRRLKGSIKIKLKNDDGSYKVWQCDKWTICNEIIKVVNEYVKDKFTLSLRQLYYQLVSKDLIPNHDTAYKKISSLLDDLRYSGMIDWSAFEDRTRIPYIPYYVSGIEDALDDIYYQYRLDRQRYQDTIVEVWTEKDAISGILKPITSKYHIKLVVNKGYSSSSAMHKAYDRFVPHIKAGKKIKVLYFGDHDPSGIDMIRDIQDRINLFISKGEKLRDIINQHFIDSDYDASDITYLDDKYLKLIDNDNYDSQEELWDAGCGQMFVDDVEPFNVECVGLTMDQIQKFKPPPNPAKISDPRAKWYIQKFGPVSWEVDAIKPKEMQRIIEDSILNNINVEKFEEMRSLEKTHKKILNQLKDYYVDTIKQ